MPSDWQVISNLGSGGMAPDLMNTCRRPEEFDFALNCRAHGNNISEAGGYTAIANGATLNDPTTLIDSRGQFLQGLILCGNSAIYEFNGTTMTDITGAAVFDDVGDRWSGGWISGGVVLANYKAVRTFIPGVDTVTQPMVYAAPFWQGGVLQPEQTWEDINWSARVFRSFGNYCFAADITKDGERFPDLILWSDEVPENGVPTTWVPLKADPDPNAPPESNVETKAGEWRLTDTKGYIIDMVTLRDGLVIYKTDAIVYCQFVGGDEVFQFRTVVKNRGIFARDTVVEYDGYHFCQGYEDIFVFDGNQATSLVYGKIKRQYLADRQPFFAHRFFTSLDATNEEILFHYSSVSIPQSPQGWSNRVLAYNMKNHTFWLREYDTFIPHALFALEVDPTQPVGNMILYGLDRDNTRVVGLEEAPDRPGPTAVPVTIRRTNLFGQPGHWRVQVDRVQLQISDSPAKIRLAHQEANNAAVVYEDFYDVDPATDNKTDARTNGQMIGFEITVNTLVPWEICSLSLLVQTSGERE